jgi:hypothetical protein
LSKSVLKISGINELAVLQNLAALHIQRNSSHFHKFRGKRKSSGNVLIVGLFNEIVQQSPKTQNQNSVIIALAMQNQPSERRY